MPSPILLVDDAIAHAEAALGTLASVHAAPSGQIPAVVAALQPDALIVRSVTRVDAALLDRAPSLRFVATATAGTDHLDLAELARRGITVASAAGCNARAVAEWVAAALVHVEAQVNAIDPALLAGPIGVVGWGNVGSRVGALQRALGREVLACDPPLARAGGCAEPLVSFEALWQRCTIVSFHVPLILDGPDRTLAYLDVERPAAAGPKLILNTSRGPVVRDAALDRPDVRAAILDVWDGEPIPSAARLRDPKLVLASPHVAGYSLEGKIAATRIIHEAVCAWLGRSPSWTGASLLPRQRLENAPSRLAAILDQVVDLPGDDARTRALAELPAADRGPAFEALRRGYALRREFAAWSVPREPSDMDDRAKWLEAAGFELS